MFSKKFTLYVAGSVLCLSTMAHAAEQIPAVNAPASPFGEMDMRQLDQMNAVIQFQEKQIKIENNDAALMRIQQEKIRNSMQMARPDDEGGKEKTERARQEMTPTFPMPGGNPVVKSLYGSGHGLEAVLVMPGGESHVTVMTGDPLPYGYTVKKVTTNSVVISKGNESCVLTFGTAPERAAIAPGTK